MDAVITKILEIEKRSQEILDEAELRKESKEGYIEKEKQRSEKQIMDAVLNKLSQERLELTEKAESKARYILRDASEKADALENFKKRKLDEWVDELYRDITEA